MFCHEDNIDACPCTQFCVCVYGVKYILNELCSLDGVEPPVRWGGTAWR